MSSIAVEIVIILVLLGLNAFLAASEIAIVSSRKARLRASADSGNRAARRVLKLAEEPGGFLATIQVGITLAGFFASAVGAVSLVEVLEKRLDDVPVSFVANNANAVALFLITIILSFLSIVIGELVPKTLAVSRAESVALRVVGPIETLSRIARPVVAVLTATTNAILRLLGSHRQTNLPSITHSEILAMVQTAEDEGVVEENEADLVGEALVFGRILVRSVMVPRVDVQAISGTTTLGTAVDLFFTTGYSRLPVFRDSPDDILGILHVKDVFRLLWSDQTSATKPVAEAIRPAYFVPESKPIDELLQELRARSTHIAIIVDEYGGMAGLVTLEDLIEELVGEITDEFDAGYEPFREIEPGVIEADGRISIGDLLDRLDIERHQLEPFEAESVGGLIADHLARIPEASDSIETGPLRLTVREMDGYRVALVRVERIAAARGDDDGEEEEER
jgi:putative hemolysin